MIAEGTANPITLARAYYWQGRAAEALGHGQEARALLRGGRPVSPPPITASLRARGSVLARLRCAVRPNCPPNIVASKSRAPSSILYALDERELASIMAAEFADKATDVHALATLGEIAAHHNDARAALLIGKTALGHGLPLEHYAFPDFGVPNYQQIGPPVERCVVFSIVRQESAFNPKVISSANALGLMQVTPAIRPRHRQAV